MSTNVNILIILLKKYEASKQVHNLRESELPILIFCVRTITEGIYKGKKRLYLMQNNYFHNLMNNIKLYSFPQTALVTKSSPIETTDNKVLCY